MSGENWEHSIRTLTKALTDVRMGGQPRMDAQLALDHNFEAFKQEAYRSLALVYRLR
jgi:hypothetical protein